MMDKWHYWWLQPDGTWGGKRAQPAEVQIVPESQRRDHLPSGCRCGTAWDVMADGVLRVTHRLYGPDRFSAT